MEGHERSRPVGRPIRRWDDNMRTYLKAVGLSAVRCINTGKDTNK